MHGLVMSVQIGEAILGAVERAGTLQSGCCFEIFASLNRLVSLLLGQRIVLISSEYPGIPDVNPCSGENRRVLSGGVVERDLRLVMVSVKGGNTFLMWKVSRPGFQ